MSFTKPKGALLSLLVTGLLALLAVGCGDSREDFVATNTANNIQANTGNLVFRFQRALAQLTPEVVPSGTTRLRFDLFSSNPPTQANLVLTETRPFSELVTLENIPNTVVFVSVTAITGDNLPSVFLTGPVSLIVGTDNEVDLGAATPVTFESVTVSPDPVLLREGETEQLAISGVLSSESFQLPINAQVASFSCDNPTVANITSTGLVSFNPPLWGGENCTATVRYTLFGTTLTDTFLIRTFDLIAEAARPQFQIGDSPHDPQYNVSFRDSTTETFNVTSDATFALEFPLSGVSVDPNTGSVTVSNDRSLDGTLFNVIVTWVDTRPASENGSGLTFQQPVQMRLSLGG